MHSPKKVLDIEAPIAVILIGVLLAIIAALIGHTDNSINACDVETIQGLLDLARSLVTGGLGGAIFKPYYKNKDES